MFRTRKLSQLLFVILSLIIISSSYGQRNYLFENISVPEGLSNSTVNYIFQDSNGFLWISTADGLNRYDGNSIKVFKNDPNDSTTIPSNDCSAIAEDEDGFIWIGVSKNIIAQFNPKNESFQSYRIETAGVTNISFFYSALLDSKKIYGLDLQVTEYKNSINQNINLNRCVLKLLIIILNGAISIA